MDTALPQKFPFILDRNLAKANGTENHVCTDVLWYSSSWYVSILNSAVEMWRSMFIFPSYMILKNNKYYAGDSVHLLTVFWQLYIKLELKAALNLNFQIHFWKNPNLTYYLDFKVHFLN